MFGSRIGSVDGSVDGCVDPPGTLPAAGVGDGLTAGVCGRTTVPGGWVGFVCCVPGGADGFCAGVVVPGIGSCPGGRVVRPSGDIGRGVDVGTCASAAPVPANTTDARTTGLINLV